eukprot:GILK01005393.1.p1 GENE.GILK01005393.1~~GILK01005393.1.p1  ORF type:complete len:236 (+),score=33.09 GILK01005393.1:41-748(+)
MQASFSLPSLTSGRHVDSYDASCYGSPTAMDTNNGCNKRSRKRRKKMKESRSLKQLESAEHTPITSKTNFSHEVNELKKHVHPMDIGTRSKASVEQVVLNRVVQNMLVACNMSGCKVDTSDSLIRSHSYGKKGEEAQAVIETLFAESLNSPVGPSKVDGIQRKGKRHTWGSAVHDNIHFLLRKEQQDAVQNEIESRRQRKPRTLPAGIRLPSISKHIHTSSSSPSAVVEHTHPVG